MFENVVAFIRELYQSDGFIPLHEPRFNGREKEYVAQCIDSTFVSSVGEYVNKFEKMICDYTGARFAIATVNGTAALHAALVLSGVKRDELVITQPLTFIATCNAISHIGAEPVFVDIDRDTLGMSPSSLNQFLEKETFINNEGACIHSKSGKRIAACVPMHTFGFSARIDEIVKICAAFNIKVVEDAAESLGSTYKGIHTGNFGLTGVFSFNGNKTITCGGGGMIVTNDEELAKRAKHITTTAKVPHAWEFNHDEIGFNYRLPNLNAAMACAQMEQLENFMRIKRSVSHKYEAFFKPYEKVKFLTEPNNSKSNYWLNAILLEDRKERDAFLQFTNANKVMTRPVWTLMTKLPMFKNCISESIQHAEFIEDRLVNIPSSVPKHLL